MGSMAKPIQHQVEGARAFIVNPSQWCEMDEAQMIFRFPCSAFDSRPRRYWAIGALNRAAFDLVGNPQGAIDLAHKAAMLITGKADSVAATRELVVVNDCYGHAAVLSSFDRALASGAQDSHVGNFENPWRLNERGRRRQA
jgi:hypothetical protein